MLTKEAYEQLRNRGQYTNLTDQELAAMQKYKANNFWKLEKRGIELADPATYKYYGDPKTKRRQYVFEDQLKTDRELAAADQAQADKGITIADNSLRRELF